MPRRRRFAIPQIGGGVEPGTALLSGIVAGAQPRPRRGTSQVLSTLMRAQLAEQQNKRFMLGLMASQQRQERSLAIQQQLAEQRVIQKRKADAGEVITNYSNIYPNQTRKADLIMNRFNSQSPSEFFAFVDMIPHITEWDKMGQSGLLNLKNMDELDEMRNITPTDATTIKDIIKYRMIGISEKAEFQSPDMQTQRGDMEYLYGNYVKDPEPSKFANILTKTLFGKPRR